MEKRIVNWPDDPGWEGRCKINEVANILVKPEQSFAYLFRVPMVLKLSILPRRQCSAKRL
jgi:hypothetical protein